MEQPFDKFLMFRNRMEKVYRHLSKQAKRQGITCYRLYDHDLPEFPLIIEIYENRLYVSEYKRNHGMDDEVHLHWLEKCKEVLATLMGVEEANIFVKLRKRKEGRLDQYQKLDEGKQEFIVRENGLKFIVNLSDYLDTGLFLDHRITRQMVKELSPNKKVLNLFCYTGSFSVYAAAGGAATVTSVDLSKTYLAWSEKNMRENFPDYKTHQLVHADVMQYLQQATSESFDLIVMDPPTFSNSKRMDDILEIQRDHVQLINDGMNLLKPHGILFFSTNYTKFKLDADRLRASEVKDITKATTPFDFTGKLKRQCFRMVK